MAHRWRPQGCELRAPPPHPPTRPPARPPTDPPTRPSSLAHTLILPPSRPGLGFPCSGRISSLGGDNWQDRGQRAQDQVGAADQGGAGGAPKTTPANRIGSVCRSTDAVRGAGEGHFVRGPISAAAGTVFSQRRVRARPRGALGPRLRKHRPPPPRQENARSTRPDPLGAGPATVPRQACGWQPGRQLAARGRRRGRRGPTGQNAEPPAGWGCPRRWRDRRKGQ